MARLARAIFYTTSGTLLKRYVFGPGTDEPLVEYDGAGAKTYLAADERGSIISRSNASGVATAKNSYDEYGIPGNANVGRFGYTGQAWIPELGMDYFKARMRSPTLGRFLQTDPIGYGDGLNWYNYVRSDPVNFSDPSGLDDEPDIVITARKLSYCEANPLSSICSSGGQSRAQPAIPIGFNDPRDANGDIVITARREKPQNKACTGPVISLSLGISGTFAFMAGGNAGGNITLNIPTNINLSNPLQGLQVVGSVQGGGLLGAGLYAGAASRAA